MTEINLAYLKPLTIAAIIADLDDVLYVHANFGDVSSEVKPMLRNVANEMVKADGLSNLITNIRRVDSRR